MSDRKHNQGARLVALLLLIVGLVTTCTGCGAVITEGEVYKKEYRPEMTIPTIIPIVISNGKTCTTTMIPVIHHYPERWVIFIKDYNGTEWVTEDWYVSEAVYNATAVGDLFKYEENRGDLNNEPYTTERTTD